MWSSLSFYKCENQIFRFRQKKNMNGRILCQFKSESGEYLGAPVDIPLDIDKQSLEKLCQALISSVNHSLND